MQRLLILRGTGRVKAVIVDLDNTLWRGLASDGSIGPWAGRPQGIAEALKILKINFQPSSSARRCRPHSPRSACSAPR